MHGNKLTFENSKMQNQQPNPSPGYLDMELMRFTTAGSVDDGKSTLIGRLLYDSKAIFEDQMEAIASASLRNGDEGVNLALLTDGLRAEREQGITIDVAYRYFATPKRKFIIADTPGHIQYTRNMVTGASTANLALILVDARHGIIEQTLRHAYIASLLQIPHVVICVNKMDLVGFDRDVFEQIRSRFMEFAGRLDIKDVNYIPISARFGDNVVDRSLKTPWYDGPTLMHLLENIHISDDLNLVDVRFPVQNVIRQPSGESHDYRGYAGRLAGGVMKPGDRVRVLPSGLVSEIKSIDTFNERLDYALAPQSVSITLEDDLDISRGDMLTGIMNGPQSGRDIQLMVCWLNRKPLQVSGRYAVKHTTRDVGCTVDEVYYKMNINTLEKDYGDTEVGLNDIAQIRISTTEPLFYDPYRLNRITGSLILIDEAGNETVGAGMII
jgi:sulfate adenylyltransferase subunit 1